MRLLRPLALLFVMSTSPILSADLPTGPEVGAKVPAFEAVDQTGKTQSLDSLSGPNGLLLLFHRSADW